jgi:hypothetical protein
MHNEELHNLYSLPNIIRKIRSRRIRCVGYVMIMGEMKNVGLKASRKEIT